MSLGDVSYGHDASIAIGDRLSEHTLAFEYSLAMVPKSPMPPYKFSGADMQNEVSYLFALPDKAPGQ